MIDHPDHPENIGADVGVRPYDFHNIPPKTRGGPLVRPENIRPWTSAGCLFDESDPFQNPFPDDLETELT